MCLDIVLRLSVERCDDLKVVSMEQTPSVYMSTAAESGEEGALAATAELLPLVQRVPSGEALTAWLLEPQGQAAALVWRLRQPRLQRVHGHPRITRAGHAHSRRQGQCQRYYWENTSIEWTT